MGYRLKQPTGGVNFTMGPAISGGDMRIPFYIRDTIGIEPHSPHLLSKQ